MKKRLFHKSSMKIVNLIDEIGVNFGRGDVYSYFYDMSKVNYGLSLDSDGTNDSMPVLIYLKNLYVLWNILVDDSVDVHKELSLINESYLKLSVAFSDNSDRVTVLDVLIQELAKLTLEVDKQYYGDLLRFDLINMINSFHYEHIIQEDMSLSSEVEYKAISTMTASIKFHLSLDLVHTSDLSEVDVRYLREGYHFLSQAIKLSSDVGTFKREVTDEQSANLIVLKGLKDKVINEKAIRNVKLRNYNAIEEKLKYLFLDISKNANNLYTKGMKSLRKARNENVNTDRVETTVRKIMDGYLAKSDNFYR